MVNFFVLLIRNFMNKKVKNVPLSIVTLLYIFSERSGSINGYKLIKLHMCSFNMPVQVQ